MSASFRFVRLAMRGICGAFGALRSPLILFMQAGFSVKTRTGDRLIALWFLHRLYALSVLEYRGRIILVEDRLDRAIAALALGSMVLLRVTVRAFTISRERLVLSLFSSTLLFLLSRQYLLPSTGSLMDVQWVLSGSFDRGVLENRPVNVG